MIHELVKTKTISLKLWWKWNLLWIFCTELDECVWSRLGQNVHLMKVLALIEVCNRLWTQKSLNCNTIIVSTVLIIVVFNFSKYLVRRSLTFASGQKSSFYLDSECKRTERYECFSAIISANNQQYRWQNRSIIRCRRYEEFSLRSVCIICIAEATESAIHSKIIQLSFGWLSTLKFSDWTLSHCSLNSGNECWVSYLRNCSACTRKEREKWNFTMHLSGKNICKSN